MEALRLRAGEADKVARAAPPSLGEPALAMNAPGPIPNPYRAIWRASDGSIALERGDTLKLDNACGATLRLDLGEAWVSTWLGGVRHLRAGHAIGVRGDGPTLIYALRPVSVRLQDIDQCGVERRRRGEVADGRAAPPRDRTPA